VITTEQLFDGSPRDMTPEHLVQANHALHDELAAARVQIAALENQLDELGEGAYRAADWM